MSDDDIRVPPHNDDAERSLLGAVMLDNDILDAILSRISPEDFFRERHRHIFRAMKALYDRDETIDVVTLGDYLAAEEKLESVGGPGFLTRLSNEVPSAANANQYVEIVRNKSTLRQFISTTHSLVEEGYSDVPDVDSFLDRAEREIFSITQEGVTNEYEEIREVIKGAYEQLESLYETTEKVTGVPSGFVDLDEITAGWQDSDLIIVAARPGMGKTTLALNMASHVTVHEGFSAAVFSLEMSSQQLAMRLLCSEGRVDQKRVRQGTMDDQAWTRLVEAAGDLKEADLFLDDTPALSIMEFRSKCRRLKAEQDIDIVFIDYLQLMTASGDHDLREQEISEISRSLKGIAKELSIPVISLAQLNRGVEKRQDKRPRLRDLRESGAIEQDADVICFIYRDEVYNEETEDKGIAEVIVRKHRNGPIGDVRLRFFPHHTRFENLAEEHDV
jgi:replicative DNA helicase